MSTASPATTSPAPRPTPSGWPAPVAAARAALGLAGDLSQLPGLGDRLAARIAGEIGDAIGQFDTPNVLQCYVGKAPATRRSGKSELVVASRLACNRYLADAVQQRAFTSLSSSGRAREFYDTWLADGSPDQN
ncbi:transposase [Solwaraspora sp. WMMB335]|uniref:transposase n=1 Tax=Solwaraspora sp. WMMB335 TaxID=3404118 RepID=UPI003B927B48